MRSSDANCNAFQRGVSSYFGFNYVTVWLSMLCKTAKNNAYLERRQSSFQIREFYKGICKEA